MSRMMAQQALYLARATHTQRKIAMFTRILLQTHEIRSCHHRPPRVVVADMSQEYTVCVFSLRAPP